MSDAHQEYEVEEGFKAEQEMIALSDRDACNRHESEMSSLWVHSACEYTHYSFNKHLSAHYVWDVEEWQKG